MGQGSQGIPAVHDVLSRGGQGIKGIAQARGGRFKILREVNLLLAFQRSSAADFLKVRLKRSPFATRVQFLRRNDGGGPHGFSGRGGRR